MSPAAGASKTVLIADDTAFVRERFKAAVEEAGHRAITVRTAAELLARIRSDLERLDLLLLDLRLPNTSGPELVRAVRKLDEGRLPIVVFSGTIASAAEVRELSSLGIAGYVNEYSATQHVLPALAPHLFPDSFNRRGSPRVALGVPIAYRFGNTIAAAVTLTLSRGGVAVRTTTPLQADARVSLRLRLPGAKADMEIDARVAWSDRRVGMGLQFERVTPTDQQTINEFVDSHFFSNRRA
jgi:uncharacterized protein (TIGR02266 family)